MKKVIMTIGDTHLADSNYGRHKDYASDCQIMMDRVASAVENYATTRADGKLFRVVILGDFADTRFSHLEFRVQVEKFLERLNAVAEKVYCLKGNHDEMSGSMTELDYYTERGLIAKHPEEEIVGGRTIRYVDFIRDPEACAQAHEGEDVEIIFTHNALGAADNTLFDSVNVAKLDAPKLRVGVMGHIHGEMYFKAHNRHGQDVSIFDGGAACVRSATRKDVASFNLLAFHIDEETGKIQSGKAHVKYVEDAFLSVEEQAGMVDGKWSVTDGADTQIDFTVTGAGSMDVDDLTTQLSKTSTPEVVATVKMLFEKYGKVAVAGETPAVTNDTDDGLAEDIASLFKSTTTPVTTVPKTEIAEDGLAYGDVRMVPFKKEETVDAEVDLDDLCDEDDGIAVEIKPEPVVEPTVVEDDIFDGLDLLAEEDDDIMSIEDMLDAEDKENLIKGIVSSVQIDDETSVVYKDNKFMFA